MKIFIVDDERIIRVALGDDLRDSGHKVLEFANAKSALMQLKSEEPDIIITDLKMPEMNGIEFLKRIKEINNKIFVILMTAHSDVETAVEAMKLGAYDYVEKPFDNEKMIILTNRISELVEVKKENKQLKNQLRKEYNLSAFVGSSNVVKQIFDLIKIVSQKSTTVLINGETGTGKELLANIIHYNSERKKKPMIRVSCAVLNREIFESELFGHEKGAFTGAVEQKPGRFEMANGGTLYLDDIDDVPLDLQVKLLRALEEREIERVGGKYPIKIDIRVIASTKKDLRKMVEEGVFREDLFYRLNVFPINLSPLRERHKDVIELTNYFVKQFSEGTEKVIEDNVYKTLLRYSFPGNVRELKNLCERLCLLSVDGVINHSILPYEIKFPNHSMICSDLSNKTLNELLEEVEKNAIMLALDKSSGNKAKAAEKLGLPASTLKSKLNKFDL